MLPQRAISGLRAVNTRCQMSCPIISPKKNNRKYVKIVCHLIAVISKWEAGRASCISERPPAAEIERGSNKKKIPTVIMQNWMMSVRVIDHMPPATEYATTRPPATSIAALEERGSTTLKTVPIAMVEVTAIMRAYAAMMIELIRREAAP